ncbi:epocide hydrolase domain-containing protein [Caballeronia temeraria]|uniref:Epocide hydrolase domain-containing protein n=2 Tax=Caballeronia temeraria TaxID=1777137 RepID=A0A158ASX3_9BURK|nr:epocide hydrolase domain-containing protein [Caballeronia temeraria]
MNARSLSINVHDSQIDDLMQRLRNTRFPASLDAQQWNDGAALAFVRRLTDYWQSQFDWRAQEARLNELPFLGRTVF